MSPGQGVLAFYKGLSFPLAAQALYKAILFSVYGATSSAWMRAQGASSLPLPAHFACGATAAAANSLVVTPVELVRNRLQVQYNLGKGRFSGPFDVVAQCVRQEGIRGMYRGLTSTLMRDMPGVGMWYTSFTASSMWMQRRNGNQSLSLPQLLLCGACGGIGFWSVALPSDSMKSIIQTSEDRVSIREAWRRIMARGGFPRFYRGGTVAFGRGIPGAAATFTTFTLTYRWLSEAPG